MSYPVRLESLDDHAAIADAIYRATLAFDTNDFSLLESAMLPDSSFSMAGQTMSGIENIKPVFDRVGPMDTVHYVTSIRIQHSSGAKTAKLTANAMNQHFRKGEGVKDGAEKLTAGGRYFVDLEKSEAGGLWKIKKWDFEIVWREGNPAVMAG